MTKHILLAFFAMPMLSCGSSMEASVQSDVMKVAAASPAEQEQANKNTVPQETKGASSFYQTVSLYGGKFKVSVPVSFKEMPFDKIAVKYSNAGNRPNVVYTNEKASINIALTQVDMPTEQEDLPEVEKVLSQQLQTARPINFQSRIEKINGSDYVIFEFESQAINAKIYNFMFATDVDGKLLMGTFNCTETLKGEWQPRAKEILLSVRKG